ncbi:MAG: energy-coupling factor ABC transporter permease [Patescibacteria group bacterium]|nr:energy-coupling factor ABC transporter permease [Patescibacteria group bacterium]
MHIPDGFLSTGTASVLVIAAITVGTVAVNKVKQLFSAREKVMSLKTPEGAEFNEVAITKLTKKGKTTIFKIAILGAFIFSMQMLNFPIAQGTSGHLLGGVLVAVMLGPWIGFLVIAVILIVQSLLFADGGLLAMGANIINMGLIGAVGGYYIYQYAFKKIKKVFPAAFLAAWASVVLASAGCALELALSGTIAFNDVFINMVGIHCLIGLTEGAITVAVLGYLKHEEKEDE